MDKKIIMHVHDIGISKSTNRASFGLLQTGHATSGSIIVPGNELLDALTYVYNDQKNMDIGIHLTITSEWQNEYMKRKPTLPLSEVPSLADPNGYFRSDINGVLYNAQHEEIKKELLNQIIIAQRLGITISHIDSHMGVLLHKKLFPIYQELAELTGIQPFITKAKAGDTLGNRFYGCDGYIDDLVAKGFKTLDGFDANSLYNGERAYPLHCESRIQSLKEGITYFLLHVLDDTIDDHEKILDYRARQKEYRFFRSDFSDRILKKENIQKITMKEI